MSRGFLRLTSSRNFEVEMGLVFFEVMSEVWLISVLCTRWRIYGKSFEVLYEISNGDRVFEC